MTTDRRRQFGPHSSAYLNKGKKKKPMHTERKTVHTNVRIFAEIAEAAHQRMYQAISEFTIGSEQNKSKSIKVFDPAQTSFKEALVSIIFTCMWLEATLHLLIVRDLGRKRFRQMDSWSYERKLRELKCADEQLLDRVCRLRETRRELVHEKAQFEYDDTGAFVGQLKLAQEEADNARDVLVGLKDWFQDMSKNSVR